MRANRKITFGRGEIRDTGLTLDRLESWLDSVCRTESDARYSPERYSRVEYRPEVYFGRMPELTDRAA